MRFNDVRAAIKLQFRDVDNFIHKDFRERQDVRYIKKMLDTKMSKDDFATLVAAVKKAPCITMATPSRIPTENAAFLGLIKQTVRGVAVIVYSAARDNCEFAARRSSRTRPHSRSATILCI